ncbi:MAG: sugar ABC transporter ATP-binding protein [Planctomycetaceae bacterium]
MTPIISFRGVGKRFPGVVALADVSFDLLPGECHALCGENGAGKSTLMKLLSGVITDHEGEILVRGRPAAFRGTRDAEAAGIAIIHQELNLVEQLSAAANIFLGRERRTPRGLIDDASMDREAAGILAELECPIAPSTPAGALRVGDQQLLEIAKAVSLQSDVLIMDEPTSALTEAEVARLDRVIARLRRSGVTILFISHKMDEVFRLADRITVLRDGRVVTTVARAATSPREITGWMVGRDIAGHHVDGRRNRVGESRSGSPKLLEIRGLTLPWPGHPRGHRLANVSLDLHAGEVLGIAGLMGAGRTELLETIFGAGEQTWTGEILLDGHPVRFSHPAEARAAGIALVTEDRKRLGLFPELDVAANVSLCRLHAAARHGVLSRSREEALVRGPLTDLDVKTPGPHAAITGLSGGNQQKCILGRWLLVKPRVLLLDDPTRGIDVGAKAELYQLIDRLCRDGLAVILTSSELPELLALADRILVLAEGRVTGAFSRDEATEQTIMAAATACYAPR